MVNFVRPKGNGEKFHSDGILILDSFCFRKWKEVMILRAAKLYYSRFLENEDYLVWSRKQNRNAIEVEYEEGILAIQIKPLVNRVVRREGDVDVVVTEGYTQEQKDAEIKEYKKPFLSYRLKWSDRDEKEKKEWNRESSVCRAWILEHVEEKFHSELSEKVSPKSLWDHCCLVIGKNQMSGDGMNLYLDLINDEFKEGEPLVDLVVRMKETHKRIKDLGYTDESLIAMMVIAKLPIDLEMVSILVFSKYQPHEITLDVVREMLEREDKRRSQKPVVPKIDGNLNNLQTKVERKCKKKNCNRKVNPNMPENVVLCKECFLTDRKKEDKDKKKSTFQKPQQQQHQSQQQQQQQQQSQQQFQSQPSIDKSVKSGNIKVTTLHSKCKVDEDASMTGWIYDSGVNQNVSYDRYEMTSVKPIRAEITGPMGESRLAEEVGEVVLQICSDRTGGHEIALQDVIYHPDLENKLISGGKIAESGAETVLVDRAILVLKQGSLLLSPDAEILLQGKRREDGLYEIQNSIDSNVLDLLPSAYSNLISASVNRVKYLMKISTLSLVISRVIG